MMLSTASCAVNNQVTEITRTPIDLNQVKTLQFYAGGLIASEAHATFDLTIQPHSRQPWSHRSPPRLRLSQHSQQESQTAFR
jgi:hypothetical protein